MQCSPDLTDLLGFLAISGCFESQILFSWKVPYYCGFWVVGLISPVQNNTYSVHSNTMWFHCAHISKPHETLGLRKGFGKTDQKQRFAKNTCMSMIKCTKVKSPNLKCHFWVKLYGCWGIITKVCVTGAMQTRARSEGVGVGGFCSTDPCCIKKSLLYKTSFPFGIKSLCIIT